MINEKGAKTSLETSQQEADDSDAKLVFNQLYQKGLQQIEKRPKNDRPTKDIEFDKQKDQCTFVPKVLPNKNLAMVLAKAVVSPRYN